MQREIKFRVWDERVGQFIRDKYSISWNNNTNEFLLIDGCGGHYYPTTKRETREAAPFLIIQQYTGLKDKSGREIYEGDRIFCKIDYENSIKSVVVWYDIFCCWGLMTKKKQELCFCSDIEVIGNIFENPELLTQKQ